MDPIRPKSKEAPFPGNGSIPLKLRELFSDAGIEPTAEKRIPWEDLPYALYDKGLYLSGLPARLFFAKDNPSREEQISRLNVLLKWPFPGVENPLKLLEKACVSGNLVIMRRPPNRNVVFEVIREDGTKMDIGKWEAPRLGTSRPRPATSSSFSSAMTSKNHAHPRPLATKITTSDFFGNSKTASPTSPARPTTSAPKTTVKDIVTAERNKTNSESSALTSDPYPRSKKVPLKLKLILKRAGVPESIKRPGRVCWRALPELLWSTGRYITGIRAEAILGTMDPTIRDIREVRERPFRLSLTREEVEHMEKALERGDVKILPREKGRNVVFEVVTEDGSLDIGKWASPSPKSSDNSEQAIVPKTKSTAVTEVEIIELEDSSNDENRLNTISPSAIMRTGGTVPSLVKPSTPSPPYEPPPGSPEDIHSSSDNSLDQPKRGRQETGNRQPLTEWKNEVNHVMDQLADMLVQAGVKLPLDPKRDDAYKINWSDLPRLLHRARVTLAGFPLKLLPYWKPEGRLNGRWLVSWNRETLQHMVDLLENDGIGIENWTAGSDQVVQAVDEDTSDDYWFTYADFVNAMTDDPEQVAVNGQALRTTEYISSGKRKRPVATASHGDRAPKRQKTRVGSIQASAISHLSEAEMETDTDSGQYGTAKTSRSMSADSQPEQGVDSDQYPKHSHEPGLSVAQLNAKHRRRKEIVKNIIAILIYHDIPCIAPEDECLDFFLPWSNLPRHLASRMVFLVGWPSLCAPVVQQDSVVTAFGPASWDDAQWKALETALERDAIDIKKAPNEHIFELVSPNGSKEMSNVNFSKTWIQTNWGFEADQSVNVFAKNVSIMDPILVETDDEEDEPIAIDM